MLGRSQSAEDAQIGRAVALDRIDSDAQFPLHGVARIEQHAEYADRTRQREPVSHDGIRRSGDVVPAAGCIGAHRNDHRFFGFEQFHFAPDHVRGQSTAAGRIHPHDDRLHPIVQPQLPDLLRQRIAVNGVVALAVDDLAVGIEHRHAIRSHVPHVGPYLCSIPAERYETILTVTVRLDTRLGEEIVHLVLVFQSVDHSLRQRIFGLDRRQLVGVFVEHLDRQAARLGHVARNDAPHRVHQLPQLFPIGIGQLREDVGFHGALVLAGRRTEHLDFEIELVEQPLEK